MAESRGDSRFSYAESTVVKHDIDTPDLQPAPAMAANRTVTFSDGLPHSSEKPHQTKRSVINQGVHLQKRLYFTPNDCQVVQILQSKTPSQNGSTLIPMPPSNMKTTMFKRDYMRRQQELKAKHDPDSNRQDTKKNIINTLASPSTPVVQHKPVTLNPPGPAQPSITLTIPSPEFTKEIQRSDKDELDNNCPPLIQLTGEKRKLPAIEQEASHTDLEPVLSSVTSQTSLRGTTAKTGSRKQDPGLVLTYLKKNKYDDSVPTNDDVLFHIRRMREKLGWETEIPRSGPECRHAMAILTKETPMITNKAEDDFTQDPVSVESSPTNPVHVKDQGETIEDDGEFLYALPRNRHNKRARHNPFDLQIVSSNEARSHPIYWTVSASAVTMSAGGGCDQETNSTHVLWWLWEKRHFYSIYQKPVFVKFRLWKTFKVWKKSVQQQRNHGNKSVLCKQLFVANEVLQGCLLHVRALCESASSSSNGVGTGSSKISLVNLDKSITYTLEDFMEAQRIQGEKALEMINALRTKVVSIVWESCATVAEMEGISCGIRPEGSKKVKVVEPPPEPVPQGRNHRLKMKYGDICTAEPSRKKPIQRDRPLYAEVAEWRKILKRLAHFLKAVDYLLLEFLRRLVVTAMGQLLQFFSTSINVDTELQLQDSDSETDASSLSSPRYSRSHLKLKASQHSTGSSLKVSSTGNFSVNSSYKSLQNVYIIPQYDFDQVESDTAPPSVDQVLEEIRQRDIVEEVILPVFYVKLILNAQKDTSSPGLRYKHRQSICLTSKVVCQSSLLEALAEEYNSPKKTVSFPEEAILSGSDYSDSGNEGSDIEEEPTPDENNSNDRFAYTQQNRKDKPASNKASVTLSPSPEDFQTGIKSMIAGFEETISQVSSLLKEPKLAVFYSPPKHDLHLNYDEEELAERQENERPWPDTVLMFSEDTEYQTLNNDINNYLDTQMEEIQEYITNYETYCNMVDQSKHVDVAGSMSKRAWTTEEFSQMLRTYTDILSAMKTMVVERRLSMIQLKGNNFCSSCLPFPSRVLQEITEALPIVANKKNEDLLTIIKGASRKLDHFPVSVEEFVEHLSFLGKMSSELPALDKEFLVVTKLFTIADQYSVHIEPEDLALYQTLAPSFQHLKSTVMFCEAKKDENIRKFSSDLDRLISSIRYQLMELKNRVRDPNLLNADNLAVMALDAIVHLQEDVQSLSVRARSYASYQDRFGSSLSQTRKFTEDFMMMESRDDKAITQAIQSELSEIERDLTLRRLLWESREEWTKLVAQWTATPFDSLKVEDLQKAVSRFTQTVFMLQKGLPTNVLLPTLKEKVMDFKQGMPVVTSLRNPALRARHWAIIEATIGKAFSKDKRFTLGNLLEMNIFKHKEKIQDISLTASNEATLEIMLQKVIDLWQCTDFRILPHTGRDTHILAGADDILAQLDESQVTVGTIRGSRYVTPIKAQVEEWERKLQVFSRTLDEWLSCQRNWLYLEQIFATPDIQRQLPSEHKLFNQVDKSWKDIMRQVEDRPNALRSAIAPGMLETLQTCNTSLEKIQKCLEDYLETKRLVFPRFYFLSNDELLDILAQSKDPNAVQPHLGKCFGNIKTLDIRKLPRQPPSVKAMYSAEGEVINMPRNVRARGPVEQWLCSVENGMFESVKRQLKLGLTDWHGITLQDWSLKHPGQVILTVSQIMFNKDVTGCFLQSRPETSLIQVKEAMVENLSILAHMVTSNLQYHQNMSIEALLTINVHNRDILNNMIEKKVSHREDFEWTKQLRYEWEEHTNQCQVLQCNASFQYGYEYLGCSPRLVITPLTDRCYLTLTGALHLHLGGSPAGPAGTGKTETVKDLAKAVGKQCVVFNCSEGLDFKMLGKFFSGLAQSGSWCCFDEFNRIDVEVLSVVAQQIQTIKSAKDSGTPRFVFEGRDIRLNMTCGYFITMNPTYAGRVELPDNLKALFRSVAMMVPDYTLIAEIMLFSEGFVSAKSLSRKIVDLYQLASKQLSQQDHYDFGMRAIKSVLVMAGHGRRASQLSVKQGDKKLTEVQESHVLIHSLRDANLPKFLAEDVPLFESILADLFPGVIPPDPDQGLLEKAITMAIRDLGLQAWPKQIEKIKQFYNQIQVRHGVMLVGPTGGGKSVMRNILQRALVLLPSISHQQAKSASSGGGKTQHGQSLVQNRAKKGHVETFVLNPKCVKLGELYGETDPHTFEWTDGLIASATRKFSRDTSVHYSPPQERTMSPTQTATSDASLITKALSTTNSVDTASEMGLTEVTSLSAAPRNEDRENMDHRNITDWRWLVLDGPVDTLWVENLNTVLDDSKVLCLANGERVNLTNSMRLIFEVDDLSQASPATISRCAMVYMDPVDLGWKPYVKTWLQRLGKEIPESGKNHLQELFDHSLDRGLAFFRDHARYQNVPAPEMCLISSLCNILSAYFIFMSKNGGFGNQDVQRAGSSESDLSQSSSASKSANRLNRKGKRRSGKQSSQPKQGEVMSDFLLDSTSDLLVGEKQYYLEKNGGQLINLLGKLFVFAFTWGIGGNFKRVEDYDDDSLNRRGAAKGQTDINICSEFDNFVHELFEVEGYLGIRLPAGHRPIYSYFVDLESGSFVTWDLLIPSTKTLIEKGAMITIGESMGVSAVSNKRANEEDTQIVPTVDNVRFSFLTGLLVLNKQPVLINGESGIGKSTILHNMLRRLCKDGGTSTKNGTVLGSILNYTEHTHSLLESVTNLTHMGEDSGRNVQLMFGAAGSKPLTAVLRSAIQFSAQTTAARLQAQLVQPLIKKSRDTLGAPRGKKVVMFVDDLSMPAPDIYGSQPPLELLRQVLEQGGFYDTKKLTWKSILDVTLVAACGPPGGGRNSVSPRLLKNFCMLALPHPSTRSLQHVYQVQLGRFFHDGDFMPEVKDCLFPLVSAAIDIYYEMCSNMLPTPAKSHYTFNIRDLSKVIQGIMRAHESVVVGKDNCIELFIHEATRVFHDRLVDQKDKEMFQSHLAGSVRDYFKVTVDPSKFSTEQTLFGDFFDPDTTDPVLGKVYRPLSDFQKLTSILEEYYMRMSLSKGQLPQMVFFKEAIEHICRAVRVFRQPGGHMLLVGVDGTGKSSIVKLSSFIGGCELVMLSLHRHYSTDEFRDDLKSVYRLAGVKGQNTVFLLTDGDIVQESFLEDINCILNSGEVPDLFDNEELEGIAMELKSAATEKEIPDTVTAIAQFFIQRVKQNLHVVLTMSPAGEKFRQRCRMNPALINCCTIDWYNEWTDEAMLSVSTAFIQDDDFICEPEERKDLKLKVSQLCVDIHHTVQEAAKKYWDEVRRRFYVTPSTYMELIHIYSSMLQENKTKFVNNKKRLLTGLMKLSEANSLVGTMQVELTELGPKIEEKAKDTEELLQQLEKDKLAVEQVQEIVEHEEAIMRKETNVVQSYADECEKDLASVLPNLQNAITALDSLDKASISEIRVYNSPPLLVMNVMAAVCVLFQIKPEWATAKTMLGDATFLKKLIQFDRNSLPDKVFRQLKKYTKQGDFNPETVGHVSLACRCICEWVLALEHYNDVYKMVTPKQKRVEEAREALKLAQGNLDNKQASLKKVQDHLKRLQNRYQESVNQREALKERKQLTKLRLDRASILITALSEEKVRWAESVGDLDEKLAGLIGDTLVSAAAVAYLGSFTLSYRNELISNWINRCALGGGLISPEFNLVKNSSDPSQVLRWQTEGLPQDQHSTENAIFIHKARKWPLLIDPQGQAESWIKAKDGTKLRILSASDTHYMRDLERAIRVGNTVLLKKVTETLDPTLKPILLKETFQRGGSTLMKLGDTEIEYNQNFRLYLSTSMANPHYLPAVYNKVNIINFTVTFQGLQEQLLSAVVSQERPQLEKDRNQLLDNIASDLQLLRDLEDKTLGLLNKSEGHILDDEDLVETLDKSKVMASELHQRVAQSEETEKKLSQARMRYLPVAIRGAVLYFVLADLSSIDVMYQFSLSWFQEMFTTSINPSSQSKPQSSLPSVYLSGTLRPSSRESIEVVRTPQDFDLKSYMNNMIEHLTGSIYRMVSIGLFGHHQLTFSLMLCTSIMRANYQLERKQQTIKDDTIRETPERHDVDKTVTDKTQVENEKSADVVSNVVTRTADNKSVFTSDSCISDREWQVLLQGKVLASMIDNSLLLEHDGLTPMERLEEQSTANSETVTKRQPPKWLTSGMWRQCQYLEITLPAFSNLCRSLVSNKPQWEVFRASIDVYELTTRKYINIPAEDNKEGTRVVFEWENLTSFQKLLLINILLPHLLIEVSRLFVESHLGSSYLTSGSFDLKEIYEESSARTPLIFILSPGSDPASQLLRFAKETRGSTLHVDMISLGRGQGPKAEELISKAQILKGRWVFLQNCHLAASWMPRLQAIVDKFSKPQIGHEVDPQFRLWLSSKPDPCFPVSILQRGLKMTVERPQGLKANLLRSFGSWGAGAVTEKLYEDVSAGTAWKPLLFNLCFLNGVLHERKKYGALGWNIPYEFNDSDLEVSVLQLQTLLSEQETVPWEALKFITGEISYGGRVTDEWDRRCLLSLVDKFYQPNALQSGFQYSLDGVYSSIGSALSFDEVVGYIETLPESDHHDVFGMTESAENTYRRQQGKTLIETILNVQPRLGATVTGSGKSNDELIVEQCQEILWQLPPSVEELGLAEDSRHVTLRKVLMEEMGDQKTNLTGSTPSSGVTSLSNSALSIVLRQEIDRFDSLLHIIHTSIEDLSLAVKGERVMSEQLEEAYYAILKHRVPVQWKVAAYESCKPLGSWVRDLVKRVEFFSGWAELITSKYHPRLKSSSSTGIVSDDLKKDHPRAFWLPAFYFPQGFLTAVLQDHARKQNISVDSLTFDFTLQKYHLERDDTLTNVSEDVRVKEVAFKGNNPPEDGVLVFGLFIDGACWDIKAGVLQDSLPGQRFCRLPEILFLPVKAVNDDRKENSTSTVSQQNTSYICPLYRTSARAGSLSSTGHSTNFVTAVNLPSDQETNFWVMRGVALLCQLDE